ncbi:MAG: hypothetical protein PHD61_10665, partial [Bacteroidales bacterium]|nr:hypothetical protein [Bacteroidales bacterium]
MVRRIWIVGVIMLAVLPPAFSQSGFRSGGEYCSFRKSSGTGMHHPRGVNSPRHSYDVLEYKLDLDLYANFKSPYPKTFSATETIHIRVDSVLNYIKLNATNYSLGVDSVGMAGWYYEHENDTLGILLDNFYYPGDSLYITI